MGQILFLFILLIQMLSFQAEAFNFMPALNNDAIYGADERHFIDSHSAPKLSELSQSVALIVSKDVVNKKLFKTTISATLLSEPSELNLCKDEKFADHHSVNSCTGFLIGEDLLVSGGHCFMDESDCKNKIIAFDVTVKSEFNRGYKISSQNIFECKNIIAHEYNQDSKSDFSLIRLKRKALGRKGLKLRTQGSLKKGDSVFMIGHPLGLPLIVTNDAAVVDSDQTHFFKATLNSFAGNSGSPVFNSKTFEVEGILVRGEEDFLQDPTLQCYRNQVYVQSTEESPESRGEGVTKIRDIIPQFMQN